MGTKRHMSDHVRDAIAELEPAGRIVDLFSGVGSVAESLQTTASVVTNDALSFTASLSRARFIGRKRSEAPEAVVKRLSSIYRERLLELRRLYRDQLAAENAALAGTREDLGRYMNRTKHVGNDPALNRRARRAAETSDLAHYELATLYFAAGYLSLQQAIEVDSIRAAIDGDRRLDQRDWLLASWIAAMSVLVNSPGHTAQFLKPNSDPSHVRIVRTWSRSVWKEYSAALAAVSQVGTYRWRSRNEVYVGDALELISGGYLENIGAVYADPPYTKDQYSRYYHVYETLFRYDFPDSLGEGRNRSDRFTTGFSLKTAVIASFHDLCRNVARMHVPLVLSYPSEGLLADAGATVSDIAGQYFSNVITRSIETKHSTMGASKGKSKKTATENIYVCTI
ncbi:MAG TPA: DNA adenine methylase [Actinophytocola sp.]|uniref:DNA adenine methylase n=1 Tax=Actinophytocola sp. TaxID=1872138 RepID=UPI002DBBFC94|nr:DNA adenine methylase [Actinophytocola sp.]HEU5476128.1 DNA adenine methylase [Actinophytocola sp.]